MFDVFKELWALGQISATFYKLFIKKILISD